jgi:hypothetical protein
MVDALMEADLEAVKRERLPETERDATARRLLEAPADDDSRYLESFEAGYRWGEEAQIFLTGPATVRDEIAATAERYDELRKTGPVEALASGVMASRTGAFITNAGTSVAMIERRYGMLLDGAHAGIAGRLAKLEAEQARAIGLYKARVFSELAGSALVGS